MQLLSPSAVGGSISHKRSSSNISNISLESDLSTNTEKNDIEV